MGDYPALMPTDQLLAEPALPAHAAEARRSRPCRRCAGVARRCPVPARRRRTRRDGRPGPARQRLRARAEALSRRSLDDCPDGAGTCDADTDTDPTESP
ncbi:hypothetical protein [Paracoccus mutanolyticus]|uniref:hypothetical protein n=1 Tax=Paracoccus mutanolyticus TaxID=1499308 RepID=UPI001CB9A91E|nr:hypothetical protein [Paracoccus mutanolyticus]